MRSRWRPARAFAAGNNYGLAPRTGATLRPKVTLVAFADIESGDSVTLDGKPPRLEATKRNVHATLPADAPIDSRIAPSYLTELLENGVDLVVTAMLRRLVPVKLRATLPEAVKQPWR